MMVCAIPITGIGWSMVMSEVTWVLPEVGRPFFVEKGREVVLTYLIIIGNNCIEVVFGFLGG